MISLANILFGDKKKVNHVNNNINNKSSLTGEKKIPLSMDKTYRDHIQNKHIVNNFSGSKSLPESNRASSHPIKTTEMSKSQEIKKSIQIAQIKSGISADKHRGKVVKNPKEEVLYSKLKNFSNIDEILNEVQSNKEFTKLFKEENKEKVLATTEKNSRLKGNYKPTSTDEAKLLKKIDEVNKLKESQEISMLGKKHFSKSEVSRKNIKHIGANDFWCSKCKEWHDQDLHKKNNQIVNVNMSKVDLAINNKIINRLNKDHSVEIRTNINPVKYIPNDKNLFSKKIENKSQSDFIRSNQNKISQKKTNEEILQKIKQHIKTENNLNKNQTINKINFAEKGKDFNRDKHSITKVDIHDKTLPNSKIEKIKKLVSINNNKKIINKTPSSNKVIPDKTNPKPEHNLIKSHKPYINYSPTGGHQDFLFSRKDFDDADDFIDDEEEEENEEVEVRKYLDRINRKFRRGGGNYYNNHQQYSDSDEVVEARFDEIEEEEKYTEMIGQKEDEEEEMRELMEIERKKHKKFHQYN